MHRTTLCALIMAHARALLHPPCVCCVQTKHQCIASALTCIARTVPPPRPELALSPTCAGMCRPAALTRPLHTSQVRTGGPGHRRRPFSARSPCARLRRFNVAMHELHFFRPSSRTGVCWWSSLSRMAGAWLVVASVHDSSVSILCRFFGEIGLFKNEPTAPVEQAHTTRILLADYTPRH